MKGARLPREIAEKVRPHRACPRRLTSAPGKASTFRGNQPGLFNDDNLLKKEEGVPKRLYFWDTLFVYKYQD
ncbi:hypothetical protein Q75_04355 [Bacillus coahuilensis p1.1.43]|uniref:Uncharacterized protein n=1 Tax=Bacillus coahuilensis p1.1.43 TaxID=1150625 RepID=A0A147KAK2_9BACI|nr:hypothetical protein Q75_04355 [Bacillus coahuilensis p1.1.43]